MVPNIGSTGAAFGSQCCGSRDRRPGERVVGHFVKLGKMKAQQFQPLYDRRSMGIFSRLFGGENSTPIQPTVQPIDEFTFMNASNVLASFLALMAQRSGNPQRLKNQIAGKLLAHFFAHVMGRPLSDAEGDRIIQGVSCAFTEPDYVESDFCEDMLEVSHRLTTKVRSDILAYLTAFNIWATANYGHGPHNEDFIMARAEVLEGYHRLGGRFEHTSSEEEVGAKFREAERLISSIT
jgi:hypothetical protein